MRYLLLPALAASVVAAADVRPLVKFGLLDVSFGPTSRLLSGTEDAPAVLPFSCLDLAVGVMTDIRLGAAIGTAALEGNLIMDISYLPVRGLLLYDLSPQQRWRRGVAFLSATYVHGGQDGWTGAQFAPYWKLACGVSYTFYALTPHAEIGYDTHWRFATLTAGLALGGTHVWR